VTAAAYAGLLGVREEGDALVLPFGRHVVGRPDMLHGGAIAGLLELAASQALADAGAVGTMLTITVDYRRAGLATETRARGAVVRLGRRIAQVDAHAWQDDPARPIATARLAYRLG
jgi:uncharacterized protein (TIGR00369 family)